MVAIQAAFLFNPSMLYFLPMTEPFAGDKKVGRNFFAAFEKNLTTRFTPKIPSWIETYHLTLTTVLWSIGAVVFGYLASLNIFWLIGMSAMIVLQYITDLFDGAVGRYRNTGLIKWGYYMDHFLDYVFLCSLLIGYAFIIPKQFTDMHFFILALLGSFMVSSYLAFAATNRFRISYVGVGPTEIRFLFIAINILLMIFGKTYMAWTIPGVLVLALCALIYVVYQTQKEIWLMDMEAKKKSQQ